MLLCGDGVGNPQWLKTEHNQPTPTDSVANEQGPCDSGQDEKPAGHHQCVLTSRSLASSADQQELAEKQADQEH